MSKVEVCPLCNGTGKCVHCNGKGGGFTTICKVCHGKKDCPRCNGTGKK